MQKQRQHDFDDDSKPATPAKPQQNQEAKDAAAKGRDLLKRLERETKQKRKGRYVYDCCGVRRWVED